MDPDPLQDVVFDPRHFLFVFKLEGPDYVPMATAWFPSLGLGLKLWQGTYQGVTTTWLRCHNADGRWIATGEEQGRRADQAEQRADQAERQATEERQANDRLLEQLRALGVQPDLE